MVSVSEAVVEALGPTLRRRRLLAVVGPPVRLALDLRVTPNARQPTIGTMATLDSDQGSAPHHRSGGAFCGRSFRVFELCWPEASRRTIAPTQLSCDRWRTTWVWGSTLEFTGFVGDVTEVLTRLTVFVNATYRDDAGFGWEGLSGAMLEASWAGLPVVATRGGGTPEGLRDGVTGTLVEPADPAGLARAVAPYLRDCELARSTGEAGWLFARERFAPDVAAAHLFHALGDAL